MIDQILSKNIIDSERALYTILCSHLTYKIDKNISNDLIIKARSYSSNIFEPFLTSNYLKKQLKAENQYSKALQYLNSFSTLNDAINASNEILMFLRYDPLNESDNFEEAVKNLGKLLGYNSFRPEKEWYEGCDNLWVMDDNLCLIIEAKSEKLEKNLISKSNISQLLHSISWFDNKYLNNITYYGVTMQYSRKKEDDVEINNNLRVIDYESLEKLKQNITKYITFLSKNKINAIDEEKIRAEFLTYNFNSSSFIRTYLKFIQ